MFLCVCSTVFSCVAAVAAGVCAGLAIPRLDKETTNSFWVGSDFCAPTLAIKTRTLAPNSMAVMTLRIFDFILFSEDLWYPCQRPGRKEGLVGEGGPPSRSGF